MIDTDKYEGHTEGPWVFRGPQGLDLGNETHAVVALYDDPRLRTDGVADMQLIKDAPLLLAEVKRLHEILEWMTDSTEPPEGWGQELPPDGTAWPWPPSDYAMNEIARLALEGKTYLEIWEGLQ